MTSPPLHLVSVREAEQLIQSSLPPFPTTTVPLTEAYGEILRETLVADRDLPPFDRVTMDGIAIAHAAWRAGTRSFHIEDSAHAGATSPSLKDPHTGCIQVMTGAMLPAGTDTIIPYEEIEITSDQAVIQSHITPAPLQNLHSRGSDRRQGETVLESGCVLTAPHLAIAAAIGQARVTIAKRPSIAIVSTGDELVDIDQPVETFQIRSANEYGMEGALRLAGYRDTQRYRIPDDPNQTVRLLQQILKEHGAIMLTGGVSMGKRDFVPNALTDCGVRNIFHKIRQKPGKPMWFGLHPNGCPIFALPGNPVSTLVCLYRHVQPALDHALGRTPTPGRLQVVLQEAMHFKPPLTLFVAVRVQSDPDGRLVAHPLHNNTSGDFSSLAGSDGFIELNAEQEYWPAGIIVTYTPWRTQS